MENEMIDINTSFDAIPTSEICTNCDDNLNFMSDKCLPPEDITEPVPEPMEAEAMSSEFLEKISSRLRVLPLPFDVIIDERNSASGDDSSERFSIGSLGANISRVSLTSTDKGDQDKENPFEQVSNESYINLEGISSLIGSPSRSSQETPRRRIFTSTYIPPRSTDTSSQNVACYNF